MPKIGRPAAAGKKAGLVGARKAAQAKLSSNARVGRTPAARRAEAELALRVKAVRLSDPPFKSTFAVVSVRAGRQQLEKRLLAGEVVRVVLLGQFQLGKAWGRNDGIDQEFALDVDQVSLLEVEQ